MGTYKASSVITLLEYQAYCSAKVDVVECFPFNREVLVYKVKGKIFTLAHIFPFTQLNVKCSPEKAVALREQYIGVIPGFHMNKRHWNTLLLDRDLSAEEVYAWIDHSYNLVANKRS
ncbi:MAG: MmcQ/YjbR family DNA-binding protein [Cytophagales bacterium]